MRRTLRVWAIGAAWWSGGAFGQEVAPPPPASNAAAPALPAPLAKEAAAFVASLTPPTPAAAEATAHKIDTALGFRFDCLHNFNADRGSTQECVRISGLRLTVRDELTPSVHAYVRLDPFSTPRSASADSPLRGSLPTTSDTALGIVDAFALTWEPRPHILVSLQTHAGVTQLPSLSGLGFANSLSDLGWRQTAVTLSYSLTLPVPMQVTFVAGNGEGEAVTTTTPQQYFGLEAEAKILSSLKLRLAAAQNGNDAGSEEYPFLMRQYATNCGIPAASQRPQSGHAAKRFAAGLVLDGGLFGASGLEVGLGWQRNQVTDLGRSHPGYPTLSQLQAASCRLDADTFFPEQDGQVGNVRRTVFDVSAKYRLASSYFIAGDYEQRRTSTGGVQAFQVCGNFSGHTCVEPTGETRSQIGQSAYTVGMGMDLAEGLALSLEYFSSSFDKEYSQMYFDGPNGKPSSVLEVFNARLAYRWQ